MSYNSSGFTNLSPVVKNLLIINVLVFFAVNSSGLGLGDFILTNFSAYYFASPNFNIWQLISYAFVHRDFTHLFFNMFALLMFGSFLERYIGSKRFLQYYMLCVFGAMFFQQLAMAVNVYNLSGAVHIPALNQHVFARPDLQLQLVANYGADNLRSLVSIYYTPIIGASGGVFGLLSAFGWLFPNMIMLVFFILPMRAKYFVLLYGLIEFFAVLGGGADGVAHYAHLGGIVVGFIILRIWNVPRMLY